METNNLLIKTQDDLTEQMKLDLSSIVGTPNIKMDLLS